jgi:hypothetical protein
MLTVDQTIEYFERAIAEYTLAGNTTELRHLQTAAGVMMKAAEANGHADAARRFRVVAAHAANKVEELTNADA